MRSKFATTRAAEEVGRGHAKLPVITSRQCEAKGPQGGVNRLRADIINGLRDEEVQFGTCVCFQPAAIAMMAAAKEVVMNDNKGCFMTLLRERKRHSSES